MIASTVLQSLVETDFGYRHEGRDWGRSESHSSLVVNEVEQRWYWNSRNMGGDALQYLILVRGLDRASAKELITSLSKIAGVVDVKHTSTESTPYEKLVDNLWEFGKTKRNYWYKRCLTDSTIDRYRLGYFDGWNVIPLYKGEKFVNFQCRRDEPKKSIKYWYDGDNIEPVMINSEILSMVNTVYITEGPVDSILLGQEGIPSVSHTGGSGFWNPEWFSLFSKISNIFYIADNDGAGAWAAKKVSKSLGEGRVRVFFFSGEKVGFDVVNYFQLGGSSSKLKDIVESESKYIFELQNVNGVSMNGSTKRKGKSYR